MGLTTSCRILTLIGMLTTFLGVVFHAVAFSTPNWLESRGLSPFVRIGFHEACFDNCGHPHCPSGVNNLYFNGCWFTYDWHFEEIRDWLLQDWFVLCRDLGIVILPLSFCAWILLVVCTALAFSSRFTKQTRKGQDVIMVILLFIAALAVLFSAILGITTLGIFYSNCFHLTWMPMPYKNLLGYSFWLATSATALFGVAFFCTTTAAAFKTVRILNYKDPHYAEDMMLGRR